MSRRTHEIGVRMALGARPADILRVVLAGGLAAAATGVIVGLGGTLGLTRLMASRLYGVTPTDPAVLSGVTALMVLVVLAAVLIPARRATRVDPAITLRAE